MKKLVLGIVLMFSAAYALASCPVYAPYNCRPGMGGKMVCGCGQ